jgi:hypothetical protein
MTAEYIRRFVQIHTNNYGMDYEATFSKMKAQNTPRAQLTSDELELILVTAIAFFANQDTSWGDDSVNQATWFGRVMRLYAEEFKLKADFDLNDAIKIIEGMMTSKMDRLEEQGRLGIIYLPPAEYEAMYGVTMAVMPRR